MDVEAWLASLPPRALDRWWRYYRLEPWDVPREFWPDLRRRRARGDRRRTKRRRRPEMVGPREGLALLRETWGL